jgi:hypothetical protein
MVDSNVPGNSVKPRKHGLARPVGVPNPVNTKPGFLQQIVRIDAAGVLHNKKPMELRTDALY